MTSRNGLLLGALALAAISACGRTIIFPRVEHCVFDSDCAAGLRCVNQVCRVLDTFDGGRHGKRFGEPCDGGAECDSLFCLGGPRGAFCTAECGFDAGCPTAFECKRLLDPGLPADAGAQASLCAVPQPLLCQGCATDVECGASGGDRCLSLDGGHFCGRDCTYTGCPDLYRCAPQDGGWAQCEPEGRTCDCVTATLGMQKGCHGDRNAFGTCPGTQTCQADGGFTSCNAPVALVETCNGVDDDCDGFIDDFVPPECTKTAGGKTCKGPQVCMGSAGLVCAAKPPEAEICNYMDDDCNGQTDEGFVDAQGRYVTLAHCGTCNHDCQKAIAHVATSACVGESDGGMGCRALSCQAGFFPYADGGACLELPDTLCRPCLSDGDCVGPGAHCLTLDGARVCGRDCSAGSAYAACPGGYTCAPQDGGVAQCVPVTGTCTCRTATLGAARSCQLVAATGTCSGYSLCSATPAGPSWSACDVASFNPEVCDSRDNNCNGVIDEGFRNAVTGKYDTAKHCGFCNNDCSRYWNPAQHHTTGLCDAAPAIPACTMGPCLTEVVGGTTYEWVNVNGDTADGCECRRVQGNTTVDLPDRGPSTTGGASWVDQNCDGVDGLATSAVFVSATAPAGGNGSRTAPFQTIAQGLAAQISQGKAYVLVAQGLYREDVRLPEGGQIFGGYSSDFLKRDPQVHTSWLEGTAPTASAIAAIHAEGVGSGAAETVVSGFSIQGWDVSVATAAGQDGQPSIAVYVKDSGPRLVITGNDVTAGRGGAGGNGKTGDQGFGKQASAQLNGAAGADSQFFNFGTCSPANHRTGGPAGLNGTCGGSNGGAGGDVVCPTYAFAGNQGAQQMYVSPGPGVRNGRGGWDWSFDTMSGPQCGHVTESGFPVNIQPHDGDDGRPGPEGQGGSGGTAAPVAARTGSFQGGRWVASPARASSGQAGLLGLGGGGGGAGGGVARFPPGQCPGWEIGATGGGGGAGGCGGAGGVAGGAGGASIAVIVVSTAFTSTLPSLTANRIQRGLGGNGGSGGFGGAGGLGGAGGFGGGSNRWSSSVGGKGGEGGNGGPGGGGGGGVGGPSYGVLGYQLDLAGLAAQNQFLTLDSNATGGEGGPGGSAPGVGGFTGTAGVKGASGNVLSLRACTPACPSGTACDANGACMPN